jgi:SAM-dependent methyltransferase
LEDAFRRYGNGGRRWLEPACGTGRLLVRLARRGWQVCGYDINPASLDYARRRLARLGRRAEVLRGDMRDFCRPRSFDAAYNTIGTFRHLLSERDALRHLRAVARSLAPGGIYMLGFDLVDYDRAEDDEETWTAGRGRTRVRLVVVGLAPERRRERIVNFLTVSSPGGERSLESAYDLLTYDHAQWLALLARSPFEQVHCSLHPPLDVPAAIHDGLFVLRLRAG